jgi:hypothetical protein
MTSVNGNDNGYDRLQQSAPPAMELERSSSFARSFFQSADVGNLEDDIGRGTGRGAVGLNSVDNSIHRSKSSTSSSLSANNLDAIEDHTDFSHSPNHQVHVDRVSPNESGDRRRARRRSSRGSRTGSSHDILSMVAAAAAAADFDESEPIHNLPHQDGSDTELAAIPRPGRVDRQTSWYTDALLQGGGSEDLSAILGQMLPLDGRAQTSCGDDASGGIVGTTGSNVADDDEVLEQYRIMAHVEASIRVKDNTGFDLAEYEKRRKCQPETKGDYYTGSKKPKPKVPEPKQMNAMGGSALAAFLRAQEPPLPSERTKGHSVHDTRILHVPDLCPGVVIRNTNQVIHIPDGEHAVRCLGCQSKMRVNLYAALVKCPECRTVSPASTTRG